MASIQDELHRLGLGSRQITFQQPDPMPQQPQHQKDEESRKNVGVVESNRTDTPNKVNLTKYTNSQNQQWPPGANDSFPHSDKSIGWVYGLLGCMKPVLSLIGKAGVIDIKTPRTEDWEIPFESISDLEWLGSGAQGAVFSGKLKNETVAVKKVRDVKETDIKHLRKLDHENIIKFK